MRSSGNRTKVASRVRTAIWRARFVVVAISLGIGASATVSELRDDPDQQRPILVAARELAAGEALVVADVAVVTVPTALVPDSALTSATEALGRVPVTALPRGLPIAEELLAGSQTVALAPEGTVVVPVRLDSAAATLLRPGDRVDLVATRQGMGEEVGGGTDPRYLARRAVVLPEITGTPEPGAGLGGGLLGGSGPAANPITLVAVAPEEAPGLSAVSLGGSVAAILVP